MYQEPNSTLNKILPIAIVVAVIGGSFLLFRDDLDKQSKQVAVIRAQSEATEQERIQLDIAKDRAEKLAPLLKQLNAAESDRAASEEAIASQRVKTNCIWVDSDKRSGQKVLANAQLYYPGTQDPIPAGSVVCDRSGNTGVIGDGGLVDPASIARTRAATPWEYHRSKWFKKQADRGGN